MYYFARLFPESVSRQLLDNCSLVSDETGQRKLINSHFYSNLFCFLFPSDLICYLYRI